MEKIIDPILKHILQYNGSRFRVNFYLKHLQRMFTKFAKRRAASALGEAVRYVIHQWLGVVLYVEWRKVAPGTNLTV